MIRMSATCSLCGNHFFLIRYAWLVLTVSSCNTFLVNKSVSILLLVITWDYSLLNINIRELLSPSTGPSLLGVVKSIQKFPHCLSIQVLLTPSTDFCIVWFDPSSAHSFRDPDKSAWAEHSLELASLIITELALFG